MAVTLAVPGVNAVLWSRQSSGAVPFGTLVALISLWCLVSAPLVFIGSFIGFKREVKDYPCRTNTIPRQVFRDLRLPPSLFLVTRISSFFRFPLSPCSYQLLFVALLAVRAVFLALLWDVL
jgi:hypothetical protein